MQLHATRTTNLIHNEPNDHVSSWSVDVVADSEDGSEQYPVGRILADELRRYEIAAWGEDVWTVADADSSGLEAAWASLLNRDGQFRDEEFHGAAEPVVYLYRFRLHEDFSAWRLSVLDACCRIFGDEALILAQHHTTWFSKAEFELLGFRMLPQPRFSAPPGYPNIDRKTQFMARENVFKVGYDLADYPRDAPAACKQHAEWLETQGPWRDLI